MILQAPKIADSAAPGQFINVYLNNDSKLLPRPISIADAEGDKLTIVYAAVGGGTEELSAYKPGTEIDILGPLGTGYNFNPVIPSAPAISETPDIPATSVIPAKEGISPYPTTHIILIGGGLGIPPLLFAAKQAKAQGLKATALLGYRDVPFMVRDFKKMTDATYSITDKNGTVLDLVQNIMSVVSLDTRGALILSCGPKVMLKAVSEWAQSLGIPAQVSLEERMGCGYGACVGCTTETKSGRKKACKDGPVFDSNEIIW
jgi:dihydroorotate dehydrogenase electron transfer subunit